MRGRFASPSSLRNSHRAVHYGALRLAVPSLLLDEPLQLRFLIISGEALLLTRLLRGPGSALWGGLRRSRSATTTSYRTRRHQWLTACTHLVVGELKDVLEPNAIDSEIFDTIFSLVLSGFFDTIGTICYMFFGCKEALK